MDEKRYFKRVQFHARVAVDIDGRVFEGTLLDISLKGVLLHFDGMLPASLGNPCRLILYLANSEITLKFDCIVAHNHETWYGLKFTGADVVSMTHLRRLLVLNTGEEDEINEELAFWLRE
ncbi:MAG: PilZ domain-containing protein [Spirochaetales bacterium]|jgi:hypothetical protein|nr:PilZ domain-containing protein [Spirochaetales bacterium]